MKELSIESIIKPMKKYDKTKITGTMDNQPIRIDLDNLVIHYNHQNLLLETIPGTYGGKRYFFFPKRPKYMRLSKYLYHWRRFHYYMDKGASHWL